MFAASSTELVKALVELLAREAASCAGSLAGEIAGKALHYGLAAIPREVRRIVWPHLKDALMQLPGGGWLVFAHDPDLGWND